MQAPRVRNAVILGLLSAVGPYAIDMYLPSLPSVAASLDTTADGALSSMTAFFITFALGQLLWGPSSDMLGRRPPLVAGVLLFIVSGIGCALAGSIEQLIAFRLLQGFGGATGIVIARAIVRDMYTGLEETRLLSMLLLVASVSPVCAPLIGNGIIALTGWRGVFWAVTAIAVTAMVLGVMFIPETLPRAARVDARLSNMLAGCRRLLVDRRFVGITLVCSLCFAGFILYLAHSPFVLSHQYGLSPMEYSIAFSVNAISFCSVMQLNNWLGARFGLAHLIQPAVLGYATVMLLALALVAVGTDQLLVVSALLFIGYGFLGIILPVSSVLALADHGDIAGTASSLMSTIQLAVGALMIELSSTFSNGTMLRMIAAIAGCGTAAGLLQLSRSPPRMGAAAGRR
jgi:DHA1 family bicyclomycin/chloramphenicol resistance-like MFS transporter